MRLPALIAVLLIGFASRAQTLREILRANSIPEKSFTSSELDGNVNAAAAAKRDRVLVVYMRVDKNNMFTGDPQLVQFSRDSGDVVRTEIKPEDTNLCCGSPLGIDFFGEYVVLSFHFNPSASTMLVLDKNLKLVTTLYGIDVREVLPGQLVFIEDMIHFAPVHPERLELADLRSGKRVELYPPQGDAMREAFAQEHARRMPAANVCAQMNDPCRPELYDEDIEFADNDRGGNFAFTVHRDASHATAPGQPPGSVESAAALYRYAWNGQGWMYCEEGLPEGSPKNGKGECTPNLPVKADMSNADFSPFDREGRK